MPRHRKNADTHEAMSLGDHLEELRERLLRALFGIAVINAFTLWYGKEILAWLCQPLFEAQRQLGLPQQTINLSPASAFFVYFKVSLLASLTISAPWIIYQLWQFLKPGLYKAEQKVFVIAAPLSAVLTALGVGITYFGFLPAAMTFLLTFNANFPAPQPESGAPTILREVTSFFNHVNSFYMTTGQATAPGAAAGAKEGAIPQPTGPTRVAVVDAEPKHPADGEIWFDRNLNELRMMIDGRVRVLSLAPTSFMVPQIEINHYLHFVMVLGVITFVAFQLPVVMVLLGGAGLVDANWLAQRRKYIVLGCFVLGLVITPSQDIISDIAFPLLLWGLFEVGLVAMRIVSRPREDLDVIEGEASEADDANGDTTKTSTTQEDEEK